MFGSCSNYLLILQRIAHFHPNWSNGTAGVRGTRILNGGRFYWEVNPPDCLKTNYLYHFEDFQLKLTVQLKGERLSTDLRHLHDVRHRHQEGAAARRRLRQHARRGENDDDNGDDDNDNVGDDDNDNDDDNRTTTAGA